MRIIGNKGIVSADTYRHYQCPVYFERFNQLALNAKQSMELEDISDNSRYERICRQISVELTNLLSELAFEGAHAKAIEHHHAVIQP